MWDFHRDVGGDHENPAEIDSCLCLPSGGFWALLLRAPEYTGEAFAWVIDFVAVNTGNMYLYLNLNGVQNS